MSHGDSTLVTKSSAIRRKAITKNLSPYLVRLLRFTLAVKLKRFNSASVGRFQTPYDVVDLCLTIQISSHVPPIACGIGYGVLDLSPSLVENITCSQRKTRNRYSLKDLHDH